MNVMVNEKMSMKKISEVNFVLMNSRLMIRPNEQDAKMVGFESHSVTFSLKSSID